MTDSLAFLHNHPKIWRAADTRRNAQRFQTTHATLDSTLGGGLCESGVIRVNSLTGIGEVSVFKQVLTQFRQHKLVMFINAPGYVQPGWLVQQNLSLERVYQISPESNEQALWAAEQCLKSGCCHSLLLWLSHIHHKQARRLQVAASCNDALVFLYMPAQSVQLDLPISIDMSLAPTDMGLQANIKKQTAGWPAHNIAIELNHVPSNAAIHTAMLTNTERPGSLSTVS